MLRGRVERELTHTGMEVENKVKIKKNKVEECVGFILTAQLLSGYVQGRAVFFIDVDE